jgi:hypothetical protein
MSREGENAFAPQFEEVERALDNLAKSGKLFGLPGRRDPMAASTGGLPGPRPYSDFGMS